MYSPSGGCSLPGTWFSRAGAVMGTGPGKLAVHLTWICGTPILLPVEPHLLPWEMLLLLLSLGWH